MKNRPMTTTAIPPHEEYPASDMVERSLIFRYLEAHDGPAGDESDDTARVPQITSAPEGIEVVEQTLGTATGQWILQVRCQCGRRWFELEPIKAATCSRCGTMVLVTIEERGS